MQIRTGGFGGFPQPVIRIEDNGFVSALQSVGHGLQRAALFAIIEFPASSSTDAAEAEFPEAQSDIILLIEEPGIHQHPNKQLVINDVFHSIFGKFNNQIYIRFQIVFTIHSEKFIGIIKFQSARALRCQHDGADWQHSASSVNVRECSEYFVRLLGTDPMSNEAFEAKMHIFSRELCEGFFLRRRSF